MRCSSSWTMRSGGRKSLGSDTAPPAPSRAPTSRFHGIIANLSTVPMTSDGRLA